MTKLTVIEMVDQLFDIQRELKSLQNVEKGLKEKLKKEAKKQKSDRLQGTIAEAVFSPTVSSSIDPLDAYHLARDNKQEQVFWENVKVSITGFEKAFGALQVEPIKVVNSTPYGKITVRELD